MASKTNGDAAVGLFERALAIDPHLVQAIVGLAITLVDRVEYLHSDDPQSDIACAEDLAERKAHAGGPESLYPLVHLAAANAWAGHDKEAKEAVAQLQKVHPGYTVQTYAGMHWGDDPTFNAQRARIVEGLRKAGLPEGDKKTN